MDEQGGASGERFDRLFGDIDAEFAAGEAAVRSEEVAERTRYERGQLQLADRLRASRGRMLRWSVRDVGVREASPREVGSDWVMAEDRQGRLLLIPLGCVAWIAGLAHGAETGPPGRLHARQDLRMVLGRLGRDRSVLRVHVAEAGGRHDQAPLHGMVQYVGADFVELATGPTPLESGRLMSDLRTVPLWALRLVELPRDWHVLAPVGL